MQSRTTPGGLAQSRRSFPLTPFPTDFLKLLLEQVIDFLLRHATLLPAFPDGSQDLLERLLFLRFDAVQVLRSPYR